MDPAHRGWNGSNGPPGSAHSDQGQSRNPRSSGGYNSNGPHTSQQSPPLTSVTLPPPNANQYGYQPPPPSITSLSGINHSPPRSSQPVLHRPDGAHQAQHNFLPTLSQATGQPSLAERERAREADQIHIKEEADRHHRELDRHRMDIPPHQSAQGAPIHLHQPVALPPRSVHSANGLLAQPGMTGPPPPPPSQPHFSLGGPTNAYNGAQMQLGSQAGSGQGNMLMPFAPGSQNAQALPANQQQQQQSQQQQQQQIAGGTGQQPILNDALSYLDQVKVQFSDHPDVYNRFLDIMKDFKGGVIDTPGVIGRVSQLFAGNPSLIQGFNTFLPPGYRIECGNGDDPNAIRVTTPAGTTVQSMPLPRPLSRQDVDGKRRTNGGYTPQPMQSQQMMMSPSGRAIGPVAQGQSYMPPIDAARQQEQHALHQQEQRGVSQLQNAASNAAHHAGYRAGMSPAPGRATPLAGADGVSMDNGAGMEKRGPVEFNHAISYVNKIKNRFATQPDIYKQFLEILQTYQRESKPIQDVYSQVTILFKTAPDLLDDFKQFLPETAAQAKAAMQARQQGEEHAMLSSMRGEPMYGSPVLSREAPAGTPTHAKGMPPIGNFAPTPNAKDNKRKRGDRSGTAGEIDGFAPQGVMRGQPNLSGKRVKQTHGMARPLNEQIPSSPSLIPALPAPLPPTTTIASTSDELAFFDRAKKAIGNKNTFNEFLKLCNIFTMDLIDRASLIHRARNFIGGNPDLMQWFTNFVGYDEREAVIENKVRIPGGRVSLSNCRANGPSYRLLPKRERFALCSGRDELARSVLNDDWASHPTWASEEGGFIAHKKNSFEEAMFRIEEERHDYDFNIEAVSRTIQLLEPVARDIQALPEDRQAQYALPREWYGSCESVYRRAIYRAYGREKGNDVVRQLHDTPAQVVPVLLARLKERKESWSLAQREWEKVWREQVQRMFWRSLDHQAANIRGNDKRSTQAKHIQSEMSSKREEMAQRDKSQPGTMRRAQFVVLVEDYNVIVDTAWLIHLVIQRDYQNDSADVDAFFLRLIAMFFGIKSDEFQTDIDRRDNIWTQFENEPESEAGKRPFTESDTALDNKLDRQQEAPPVVDDDEIMDESAQQDPAQWQETLQDSRARYDRIEFPYWGSLHHHCLFRLFVVFYQRLLQLKQHEADCRVAVEKIPAESTASRLGLIEHPPSEYFYDTSKNANYYEQMLRKMARVMTDNSADFLTLEEPLRRFYLAVGYKLYSCDKWALSIARYASTIQQNSPTERGMDINKLFEKDRVKAKTTPVEQTAYRNAVERILRDSDLYRITFNKKDYTVTFSLVKKNDPLYDYSLSPGDQEHRWRFYVASYTSVTPTQGVDHAQLSRTLLPRNLRKAGADPKSTQHTPVPSGDSGDEDGAFERRLNNITAIEKLNLRIAVNSYQPLYEGGTADSWILSAKEASGGEEGVRIAEATHQHRASRMLKLQTSNTATQALQEADLAAANKAFDDLVAGESTGGAEAAAPKDGMEVDA